MQPLQRGADDLLQLFGRGFADAIRETLDGQGADLTDLCPGPFWQSRAGQLEGQREAGALRLAG